MTKIPTPVRTVDRRMSTAWGLQPGEDGGNAQIAAAAGQFGEHVLSASFLPFPLAPVRQEGARRGHLAVALG
jgi:hypothetical protein